MRLHPSVRKLSSTFHYFAAATLSLCVFGTGVRASAQVVVTPSKPVIGSSNPVSAEPLVSHPNSRSCTVNLFTNLEFADFNTKNFTYTPPAGCEGPWSKVIFKADFTVTAGRQFDRTAQFFLGGANIYFGTTAEPRAALSPSWHVESDLTDLSAIFKSTQAGTALLGNFVGESGGVDYTGIIYANAELVFYPADNRDRAPAVPDVVIGIPGNGGAGTLNDTSSLLTQSVTLPTNVERAYLDVIAQSQSGDEFWYLCVPNDQAGPLESCGGTGYRETEISIDGVPAGIAPVYPWIYTGGIDPYLWEPIPGVQTLNFKPFRVNLTPFAGVLSDGKPHTVGISVFNANGYFAATGNLLVFQDKNSKQVTGQIVSNSLKAPVPTVKENVVTDASGNITGSVSVGAKRKYTIVGTARTSHGLVSTRVDGDVEFNNTQNFIIDQTEYKQSLTQSTKGAITALTLGGGESAIESQQLSYPFTFVYDEVVAADGSIAVINTSDQKYLIGTEGFPDPSHGWLPFIDTVSNEVSSTDTLNYDTSGNFVGHTGATTQTYIGKNSDSGCYSRTLTSKTTVLTSYKDGAACKPAWNKK